MKTLRGLDIRSNRFEAPGAIALAELLQQNHTLQSLMLEANIGVEGGTVIGNALAVCPFSVLVLTLAQVNKGLTNLFMQGSMHDKKFNIGREGGLAIGQALKVTDCATLALTWFAAKWHSEVAEHQMAKRWR